MKTKKAKKMTEAAKSFVLQNYKNMTVEELVIACNISERMVKVLIANAIKNEKTHVSTHKTRGYSICTQEDSEMVDATMKSKHNWPDRIYKIK